MTVSPRIVALHRYPMKGLSPEGLDTAELVPGGYFPGDRIFAVENGPSGFDPSAHVHQPKIKFLMLMRDEALARLSTRYDDATGVLTIREDGRNAAHGDLATREGRLAIEAFFRRFLWQGLRGPPKVLTAPHEHRFTDSRSGYVSLLNLASVAAVETFVGATVDPLRFRMNVQLEGLDPWAELDLVGTVFEAPSGARLEVTKRTERCAATNVDPGTGLRDLAIPQALRSHLGHADCGVYARVLSGGRLRTGDALVPVAA